MNTTTKREKRVDYRECFANPEKLPVNEIQNCVALTEPLCKTTGKCPFYKTEEIINYERTRTKIRLAKLGLDIT